MLTTGFPDTCSTHGDDGAGYDRYDDDGNGLYMVVMSMQPKLVMAMTEMMLMMLMMTV